MIKKVTGIMSSETTRPMDWTKEDDPMTEDPFPFYYALIIYPICIMGLFGNFLSLIVFLGPSFRHLSINVILAALSFFHFFLLLISLPNFWPDDHLPSWLYVVIILYLYPLAQMFHCCSIWLLIAITLERWVAVCRPLFVTQYCTRNRALTVILLISILAVILNLVRFWDAFVIWEPSENNGTEFKFVKNLQNNDAYVFWYKTVFKTAVLYVIPLLVISFTNCLIVKKLSDSHKLRREMTSEQRSNEKTARMLLFVILCFIICYTLALILNLLEVINPSFLERTRFGAILVPINNGLVALNASTTFLFYLKFSSRYRRRFIQALQTICFIKSQPLSTDQFRRVPPVKRYRRDEQICNNHN